MSDRYNDRYGSYDDGYDDYDERYDRARRSRDARASRTTRQSSASADNRTQRYARSFDDQEDAFDRRSRSTSSRARSGSSRVAEEAGSRRRVAQSSDARYRPASSADASSQRRRMSDSAFSTYYDDDASSYSRSSYGSGRSRSSYGSDVDPQTTSRASSRRAATSRQGAQAASSRAERSSRGSHAGAGTATAAPKRSNRKRNLIIAAVVVIAIVVAGAGMAFAYVNSISKNLHEGVDEEVLAELTPTNMANEAFYMLLIGTDGSAERYGDGEFGDRPRSDSMILARIDPINKKVTLISIDRDTMVDLGEYGTQKINTAYYLEGAAGAVSAVSKMTGLSISHYASVDFDGFVGIVDSLGGVEVDVPMAIDDPDAGGSVEAGLQTLNGQQALILCRARHAYDEITTGGIIRDGYQRIVLSAIAKKILSSDILTIANSVQEVSRYVTTDLDLNDIIGLAQLMKGLDPSTDIYTAHEPTESLYVDDVWYELLDEEEWAKMISRMEQGLPPSEDVEIDEATGVPLATNGNAAAVPSNQGVDRGRATATSSADDEEY